MVSTKKYEAQQTTVFNINNKTLAFDSLFCNSEIQFFLFI